MPIDQDLGGEIEGRVSADYQLVPHIDGSTAAANTAVTKTLSPASATEQVVMSGIDWSYSGTPTNGYITIVCNSKTWKGFITAGGIGFHRWERPKVFDMGKDVVITMAAGGVGVIGYFNEQAWSA